MKDKNNLPKLEKNRADEQRRRNPRVQVNMSVKLETLGPGGSPQMIKVKAINVSSKGATLMLDETVEVRSFVRIVSPFGKILEAKVNRVWMDDEDGKQRVSITLLAPEGWGLS